jgi:hypothetical protein
MKVRKEPERHPVSGSFGTSWKFPPAHLCGHKDEGRHVAELVTMALLFDKMLSVIGLVRAGKRERDEKMDLALFALSAALNETQAYNSILESGGSRDHDHEHRIAVLWHNASIALRYVDRQFADRCFLKRSYWMNPDVWDDRRVKRNGITLRRMTDYTRKLITSTRW